MPIPKPHRWQSIVHLHGLIQDDDPYGEGLVLTSSDFGRAYLTEGWASGFVTELIRNFTVLFVGYSVDDPVIRYMTDAIAAEKGKGDGSFGGLYTIARTPPGQKTKNKQKWEAKGVIPIFYYYNHSNLHKTLEDWSHYVRDGLSAKEYLIRREAVIKPVPPYDDPIINRVIETLRSVDFNEVIDSKAASVFKDVQAPVEWMVPLKEKGLLKIYNDEYQDNKIEPGQKTLWGWLIYYHLDKAELIHEILNTKKRLHPKFKAIIKRQLKKTQSKEDLDPNIYQFWKLIINDCCYNDDIANEVTRDVITRIKSDPMDPVVRQQFVEALKTKVKFHKSLNYNSSYDSKSSFRMPPYIYEIMINISRDRIETTFLKNATMRHLTGLLLDITCCLNECMQFHEIWRSINQAYCSSEVPMPTIQYDEELNCGYWDWTILIELCRDLLAILRVQNQKQAQNIFELWKQYQYPIFQRLVLHFYSKGCFFSGVDEPVNYLLQEDAKWFLSPTTSKEVEHFLEYIADQLTQHQIEKLCQAITRDYIGDSAYIDKETRQLSVLSKMKQKGILLTKEAAQLFETLDQDAHVPKRDDAEPSFNSVKIGFDSDISVEGMQHKEPKQIYELLIEKNLKKECLYGRFSWFRELCQRYPQKAIDVLRYLSEKELWDVNIWQKALAGLAFVADQKTWHRVAPILLYAPDDFYQDNVLQEGLSLWVQKESQNIEPQTSDENYFWDIANKLLDFSDYPLKANHTRSVEQAINHPVGIVVSAFFNVINNYNAIEKSPVINDPNYLQLMQRVIFEDREVFLLGRIILASRLPYLYSVMPEWTRKNLLPHFDWTKFTANEVCAIWQGFLWSPKLTPSLTQDLKNSFKRTLIDHLGAFSHKDQNQLCTMLVLACIECPDISCIPTYT